MQSVDHPGQGGSGAGSSRVASIRLTQTPPLVVENEVNKQTADVDVATLETARAVVFHRIEVGL